MKKDNVKMVFTSAKNAKMDGLCIKNVLIILNLNVCKSVQRKTIPDNMIRVLMSVQNVNLLPVKNVCI